MRKKHFLVKIAWQDDYERESSLSVQKGKFILYFTENDGW